MNPLHSSRVYVVVARRRNKSAIISPLMFARSKNYVTIPRAALEFAVYDRSRGSQLSNAQHLIARLTRTTPEAIRSEGYHRAALSRPIRHACSLTICRNRAQYVALPVLDLHETGLRGSRVSFLNRRDYR